MCFCTLTIVYSFALQLVYNNELQCKCIQITESLDSALCSVVCLCDRVFIFLFLSIVATVLH